ncbi:MAG: NAD(P)-dependent oxidoreductase [Bdellovibrionota bacterium]|nr:MAG: NAD(P)-dependent oxidoreductase [Bdellovibrionota bacterium]
MTTHVLLTGGAGYVGSILCEHLLDAGYRVTVLDNLSFGQHPHLHLCANQNYEFVFGDCRSESLMKKLIAGADVICPLAAVVGAPACDRDPWMAKAINFEAVQLVNKLRSPSQLLILPMTNSGYGQQEGNRPCTEDTPLEPISLYGETKVAAEKAVLDSPNALSLRLATVFGASPRMRLDLLVNNFTYLAFTEGSLVIFEKDFKRNFVHVRDVADCFVHCIKNSTKMAGRSYNLGIDSANMSKEQLAYRIKEYVPKLYIHFAEVGTDPDKRDYIVSNQRLREAGFEATRTIDAGIKELLKAFQMLRRNPLKNV